MRAIRKQLARQPLIRLLAINLAIGITAALVMLGGLLALNPAGLRDLILADRAGGAALMLLLFGLVVTFGSVAMGTAIMTLGPIAAMTGSSAVPRRYENRAPIAGSPSSAEPPDFCLDQAPPRTRPDPRVSFAVRRKGSRWP